MPSAMSLRAASRFSRARLSVTSGYAPSEISFSRPLTRYFSRQSRLPVGITKRNKPRSSESLKAFSRLLALRTLVSFSMVT